MIVLSPNDRRGCAIRVASEVKYQKKDGRTSHKVGRTPEHFILETEGQRWIR